jgi:hypothetical protein
VNADGSNVAKAVDQITDAVNSLAKSVATAGKVKFQPVNVATAEKDLQKLNRQFDEAIKRSRALAAALKDTGQTGRAIHEVDFSKLGLDQHTAQRMRDRAFGYAARGTAWDMGRFAPAPAPPSPPVPSNPRIPPPSGRSGGGNGGSNGSGGGMFGRFGGAFANGVGGGFGQISNSAFRGAQSGAGEGGGAAGGLSGLLRGGLIGAGLFGLFKAGQGISEGFDMAKERDLGLDTLKRQMGDLGVSFAGLKAVSDEASRGLGVNSKEFVALADQYNKMSHNADKSVEGLGDNARSAIGFSRAYGLDPGQGVGFFGAMKNIDPKQNNRELALQIAEAINKSGGRGMAADVMQFVQTMASSVARLSLSTPNTGAYAAAYGSMLRGGSSGMTADAAAAILGQANSAMSSMGNMGEAGNNFTLGSFSRHGISNPFLASALASGGLFATASSTFGANTEYGKYLRANGIDPDKNGTVTGGNRDITNFQSIRENLDRQFDNPYLKLDAAKNFFGLQSNQQAAALMNLNSSQFSGLGKTIARSGLDINKINASGMATLADIGGAGSHADLDSIYAGIKGRTGASALSLDERKQLDAAQGGSTEAFRDALVKVMGSKDQQETEGSKLRASIKDLETVQTSIGDKLIGPVNTMRDALLKIAGGTAKSLHKAALDGEIAEMNEGHNQERTAIAGGYSQKIGTLEAQRATLNKKLLAGGPISGGGLSPTDRQALSKQRDAIDAQLADLKNKADADLAGVEKRRAEDKAAIDAREKSLQSANDQLNKAAVAVSPATGADAPTSSIAGVQGDPNGAIGERNNNPFDMRPYAKGQAQSGGYMKFDDMQTGVNAGFRNLLVAQDVHHRNTIAQIVAPYAPKKDRNDTNGYIAHVAKWSGFGKDEALNLHDPKVLRALGKAMLRQENAKNTVTDDQIDHGVQFALGGPASKIDANQQGMASAPGAQDTLNVNVKIDTTGKNPQGGTVQHTVQTSVAMPRGAGVQTVNAG